MRPWPLEQPQRLRLLLVCFSLGVWSLRRPLPTAGPTPGRGSGSRVSRMLELFFPLGSRPFDHRQDLLRQAGQVSVVEGLDVRIRRSPLHPDGGPTSLDGNDDRNTASRSSVMRGWPRSAWRAAPAGPGSLSRDRRRSSASHPPLTTLDPRLGVVHSAGWGEVVRTLSARFGVIVPIPPKRHHTVTEKACL